MALATSNILNGIKGRKTIPNLPTQKSKPASFGFPVEPDYMYYPLKLVQTPKPHPLKAASFEFPVEPNPKHQNPNHAKLQALGSQLYAITPIILPKYPKPQNPNPLKLQALGSQLNLITQIIFSWQQYYQHSPNCSHIIPTMPPNPELFGQMLPKLLTLLGSLLQAPCGILGAVSPEGATSLVPITCPSPWTGIRLLCGDNWPL